ncbi:unnamed protein product [marine sediment metagenome]|uniref:Uncharacterized protein n=1 Tax=marine sediment metagenome TaxID=412755 RepID=X1KS33_9ZZZZ
MHHLHLNHRDRPKLSQRPPVLTTHYDITEFEKCQAPATQNAAVAIAITDADQSLGSKDITVDIPADATITSVIALARINIMNNAATAQKIDLKFEVAVDGGAAVALFSQTDVVGFGAVDGASAAYVIAEDASDEVTADAQVFIFCCISARRLIQEGAEESRSNRHL